MIIDDGKEFFMAEDKMRIYMSDFSGKYSAISDYFSSGGCTIKLGPSVEI